MLMYHEGAILRCQTALAANCFVQILNPMPNVTFIGAEMWEYSPKTVKISIFRHKFVPQGRLVCTIFTKFTAFVRVCR